MPLSFIVKENHRRSQDVLGSGLSKKEIMTESRIHGSLGYLSRLLQNITIS